MAKKETKRKPRRPMTTDEIWIAWRVKAGSGFPKSFLHTLNREVKKKNPTITDLQSEWLWELLWRCAHMKGDVKTKSGKRPRIPHRIVSIANARHESFSFKQRVIKTRRRVQLERRASGVTAEELKQDARKFVETFGSEICRPPEATQATLLFD